MSIVNIFFVSKVYEKVVFPADPDSEFYNIRKYGDSLFKQFSDMEPVARATA